MDIIITFSTQEITRQNKFQMSLIDKLLLKQIFDQKIMINVNTCSIFESPSTSEYDEMDNIVYK